VLISNYQKYFKLVEFFSRHTKKRMGVIMGAATLVEIFNERYYRDLNGGILEAFGILFSRDLKILLYPWKDEASGHLWTSESTPIHPRLQPLYNYLVFNKRISDITDYNPEVLSIFSRSALDSIKAGGDEWVNMVPDFVDRVIQENCLFGYCGVVKSEKGQGEDPAEAAARAIEQKT
jgi:hypothetical protein